MIKRIILAIVCLAVGFLYGRNRELLDKTKEAILTVGGFVKELISKIVSKIKKYKKV